MKILEWVRGLVHRDGDAPTDDYVGDEPADARVSSLGAIGAGGNPPVMPQDDRPRH